jgi:type II restriction/modification system DNA methylase subunit YeeA
MDKSAIKNYAVWARNKLIDDITQKAFEMGITEDAVAEVVKVSSDTVQVNGMLLQKHEAKKRASLIARMKEKGFQEVIEETAYTWFNRIIAIRFMEVNDYLPTGVRVLSSTEEGKAVPDILTNALYLDLDLDLDLVNDYLDKHKDDELFRYLFTRQCNKLNEILPHLFDKIEDYTELLLPNNLLIEGSVIRRLVSDIKEEDFKDVEIIGWMYQYYISEKKDEVFAGLRKNKKITKENIPAATQLFTPDWIVKYMVENSLGRLWLEGHPDDTLKANWKYYLDEAEQEPDVQKQLEEIREKSKKIRPEDIKLLDPCMGSGHILVYAFDALYEIYKSAGYAEREIPKLILANNLYGLDIDDRAAQLAYFAVMMKARSKSRRILNQIRDEKIDLNLCAIQESNGTAKEAIDYFTNGMDEKFKADVWYLVEVFHDAKEYGSILEVEEVDFEAIEKRLSDIEQSGAWNLDAMLYHQEIKEKLMPLVKQAQIMSQKYDVVCTNPPYMGRRRMNAKLAEYLTVNFPDSKSDLFAVFMEVPYTIKDGYLAMINQHSWMFLSSFEKLRKKIISFQTVVNMLHLGARAFEEIGGEVVQSTAFVLRNNKLNYKSVFVRLVDIKDAEKKETMMVETMVNKNNKLYFVSKLDNFKAIPGMPIAYWVSDEIKNVFEKEKTLGETAKIGQGLKTGDNNRFVRMWFEVNSINISFNCESRSKSKKISKKWYPYANGGEFRKWYGNFEDIVNWQNDGFEIRNFFDDNNKLRSRLQNMNYYFKRGLTWSALTSKNLSVRFVPDGIIYGGAGYGIFNSSLSIYYLLSLLNSKIPDQLVRCLSETMNFEVGILERIPVIDSSTAQINNIAKENIYISRTDWDSFETSWDFKKHPLLTFKGPSNTIEDAFNNWSDFTEKQFNQLKQNEEELNRIFIDIYGLQDELIPEVEDKDVTIRKADLVRDIKSFVSYAVGCMFGRYSLDADGLIYAGGEWTDKWQGGKVRRIEKDKDGTVLSDQWVSASYLPDEDNILPILDDEYFDDDIVAKFIKFLKIAFGEDTLEENIDFIAEALGRNTSETSRQAIRRYFLKDFYKDHVQTYQKRPIYLLFDSGRADGFKALIYMHRYDQSTIARVRTDYLHNLQRKYEAEVKHLDVLIDSNVSQREKNAARKKKERLLKQIEECLTYDQVIAHVANQRISIDLDDGVKVNYAKFQGVETPQGEGKKPLMANLLAKI